MPRPDFAAVVLQAYLAGFDGEPFAERARAWLDGAATDRDELGTRAQALSVDTDDWTPTGNDGYLADLVNAAIQDGLFGPIAARFWLTADGTGHVDGALVTADLPDGRRGASEFTRLREFAGDGDTGVTLAVKALSIAKLLITQAIAACVPLFRAET